MIDPAEPGKLHIGQRIFVPAVITDIYMAGTTTEPVERVCVRSGDDSEVCYQRKDIVPAEPAPSAATALLPCPFCGGEDIYIEPDERGSGGQWVYPLHVGCKSCGCEQVDFEGDSEADAAARWNRRALSTTEAMQPAEPIKSSYSEIPNTSSVSALAFQVQQPHEWGYRDPVEGGFIPDNTPFNLASAALAAEAMQAAPPAEPAGELPAPLPDPVPCPFCGNVGTFTADQMRSYALAIAEMKPAGGKPE